MKTTSYPKVVIRRLNQRSSRKHHTIWPAVRGLFRAALSLLVFCGFANAGTHTWSGAGANTNWSTAANWSSGGAPSAAEAAPVTLIFPAAPTSFNSTPNVSGLKVDSIQITVPISGSYTFLNGSVVVQFTGNGATDVTVTSAVPNNLGSVVWKAPITLQSTSAFSVAANMQMDIQSVISGSGGLTKQGAGTLRFSTGGAANTFDGTMRVEAGTLNLAKISATPCFGGNLEIVGGSCQIGQSNMIPDTASILIDGGTLTTVPDPGIATVTEVIGPVTMWGRSSGVPAIVVNSPNTLSFSSTVTVEGPSAAFLTTAAPSGYIGLGGGTRTFQINGVELQINGNVVDGSGGNGGITKLGTGVLSLNDANTFDGPVSVQEGTLAITSNLGLGNSTGDTTVTGTGTLRIGAHIVGVTGPFLLPAAEAITVSGNGQIIAYDDTEIPGPITLGGSAWLDAEQGARLTLSGVLSGSPSSVKLSHPSGGIVRLTGSTSNTYSGSASVAGGTLELAKSSNATAITGTLQFNNCTVKYLGSNQIANTGSLYWAAAGTLDLNSFSETVAYAWGPGYCIINLGNGSLTVNGTTDVTLGSSNNLVNLQGTALSSIHKQGSNTWTIYSNSQAAGNDAVLSVEAGVLDMRGYWSSEIKCPAGTLRGSASVKKINSLGGEVCLCDLTTGSLVGSNSGILSVRLNGDVPGVSLDRLVASGVINLTGQTLQLSSAGFIPMTSGRYTIIDGQNDSNASIIGTFNGLPEGATLMLNGRPFRISYVGGSNHRSVELIFLGTGTPGPEILSIERPGIIKVNAKFLPNRYMEVHASTDLVNWSRKGIGTTDAQGLISYTFGGYSNPKYFFRLVVP